MCIKSPIDGAKSLFPTMGDLWEKASAKFEKQSFERIQQAVGFTGHKKNIEDLLSRCQMRLSLEPAPAHGGAAVVADAGALLGLIAEFVKQAELVIRTECRQPLDKEATEVHEDFLRRLSQFAVIVHNNHFQAGNGVEVQGGSLSSSMKQRLLICGGSSWRTKLAKAFRGTVLHVDLRGLSKRDKVVET